MIFKEFRKTKLERIIQSLGQRPRQLNHLFFKECGLFSWLFWSSYHLYQWFGTNKNNNSSNSCFPFWIKCFTRMRNIPVIKLASYLSKRDLSQIFIDIPRNSLHIYFCLQNCYWRLWRISCNWSRIMWQEM